MWCAALLKDRGSRRKPELKHGEVKAEENDVRDREDTAGDWNANTGERRGWFGGFAPNKRRHVVPPP